MASIDFIHSDWQERKEKSKHIFCWPYLVGSILKGFAQVGIQGQPLPAQTLLPSMDVPH